MNVTHIVQIIRDQRTEPFVSCPLLSEIRDSEAVLSLIVDPWFEKVIERSDRHAPNSNSDAVVELLQVHLELINFVILIFLYMCFLQFFKVGS